MQHPLVPFSEWPPRYQQAPTPGPFGGLPVGPISPFGQLPFFHAMPHGPEMPPFPFVGGMPVAGGNPSHHVAPLVGGAPANPQAHRPVARFGRTWGKLSADPAHYQVLKTNIKLDIDLSSEVALELQSASPSFAAALVCETSTGKEYVFRGGIELQKVQVKKTAVHFKILINPISNLKKELVYCDSLPLSPGDRKSHARFWIRFFYGQDAPIDTARFFLFIRRDEQREHARGGHSGETVDDDASADEDNTTIDIKSEPKDYERTSGIDSNDKKRSSATGSTSISSSATDVPPDDDIMPASKRRAVESPTSEAPIPKPAAPNTPLSLGIPQQLPHTASQFSSQPLYPWLAHQSAAATMPRLAMSSGPSLETNRLTSPTQNPSAWKKSSSGVPATSENLPALSLEALSGTPPAPLYSSTLPKPQTTTLQQLLHHQQQLGTMPKLNNFLSASAPASHPWNNPLMMPSQPFVENHLNPQFHALPSSVAVAAPHDLLLLTRLPDPVQICTQVIKPHITVKINRAVMSALKISEGNVEVQLIWSCLSSESALDMLGSQPVSSSLDEIRFAPPGMWKTFAVPNGLFYETNKVFFADTTALQFKHIHVNNWTSIKSFVREEIPGGACGLSPARERMLKLNYGLRFNFKSSNNTLLTWVDLPGLFTLDIRRENDPNYAKKKALKLSRSIETPPATKEAAPSAPVQLSPKIADKNAIDFLVSAAAAAGDERK